MMGQLFTNKVFIISLLTVIGIAIAIWCVCFEDQTFTSFMLSIATELLGGVITIYLFDVIIGDRDKKKEQKEILMRDLRLSEFDLREWAFIKLIDENLFFKTEVNKIDLDSFTVNNKNISKVTFAFCSFYGTNLKSCVFIHCKFYRCSFIGSVFNNSTFIECIFEKCNFSGCYFISTNFKLKSKFVNCEIETMITDKTTSLTDASFTDCTVIDAKTKHMLSELGLLY